MISAAPKLEIFATEQYGNYLLRNPREITQILNNLIEKRVLITAYPDGHDPAFVTTLLAVDERKGLLLLDRGPDPQINQQAANAAETACDTALDRVKVQWILGPLSQRDHAGAPAFAALLPEALLRLQRRNYFRLSAPAGHLLSCRIPIVLDDGRRTTVSARVVDISAGGLGLLIPPEGLAIGAGQVFDDCLLQLADGVTFPCSLKVRNVFRGTNRSGITMLRCGCEFLGLPPNATTQVQKYIMKVERDRIARERGL